MASMDVGFAGGLALNLGHMASEIIRGAAGRSADYELNIWRTDNPRFWSWPLEMNEIIELTVGGILNPDSAVGQIRSHGFTASRPDDKFFQHTATAINQPNDMLGFEVSFLQNWFAGVKEPADHLMFNAQRTPNIDECLTLFNRGNLNEDAVKWYMHKEGVRDQGVYNALVSLRNEIPPVADLIRFAVRDAFYPDIVAAYGEADEYPRILDKYISWQGLGWDTGYNAPASTDADGNAVGPHPASWGEIAWFAHWEFPSATQGYDMLHMLYADSRFGPSPYVSDGKGGVDKSKVFDLTDLNRLLRASGYSTYWRNKVTAIADPPLSRIDVRKLHLAGIITDSDVYHNYRAQGYADKNAWWLTQLTIVKEQPDISKQVCTLYQQGILDEDNAMQTLQKNGHNQTDSSAIMYQCKLEQKIKEVQLVIDRIHKSVLSGAITDDQARGLLAQVGINPDQINVFANLWGAEKSFDFKLSTRSELLGWYVDGIADRDDIIGRLQRLGYTDTDISYYLTQADVKRSMARQKASDKEDKDNATKAKQAASEAKKQQAATVAEGKRAEQQSKQQQAAATKAAKAAQAALKASAKSATDAIRASIAGITPNRLRAWYVAKEISVDQLRSYLGLIGWSGDAIDKYVAELDREIGEGIVIEGPGKTPTVAEE